MLLLIANRGDLSGAADAIFIKLLPWVVLAVFVVGMVLAVVLRSTAPDRYAGIGQFELAEAPDPTSPKTTGVQA